MRGVGRGALLLSSSLALILHLSSMTVAGADNNNINLQDLLTGRAPAPRPCSGDYIILTPSHSDPQDPLHA